MAPILVTTFQVYSIECNHLHFNLYLNLFRDGLIKNYSSLFTWWFAAKYVMKLPKLIVIQFIRAYFVTRTPWVKKSTMLQHCLYTGNWSLLIQTVKAVELHNLKCFSIGVDYIILYYCSNIDVSFVWDLLNPSSGNPPTWAYNSTQINIGFPIYTKNSSDLHQPCHSNVNRGPITTCLLGRYSGRMHFVQRRSWRFGSSFPKIGLKGINNNFKWFEILLDV